MDVKSLSVLLLLLSVYLIQDALTNKFIKYLVIRNTVSEILILLAVMLFFITIKTKRVIV